MKKEMSNARFRYFSCIFASFLFLLTVSFASAGTCPSFDAPAGLSDSGIDVVFQIDPVDNGTYKYSGNVKFLGPTTPINGRVVIYAKNIEVIGEIRGIGNGYNGGAGECIEYGSGSPMGENGYGPLWESGTKGGGGEGGCRSHSGGGGGASHGGLGGKNPLSECNISYETATYSYYNQFSDLMKGSGGGGGNGYGGISCCANGGSGGAALMLVASQNLIVRPSAYIRLLGKNGQSVGGSCTEGDAGAGGGGSGGALTLAGKNVDISGGLLVYGGDGGVGKGSADEGGSGGGGGRIKIFYETGNVIDNFNYGGGSGKNPGGLNGGVGTYHKDPCTQGQPCTPSTEICNGVDDDCDTLVDEDLGSTTCGIGACQRTVQNCIGGVVKTCVPGTPGVETLPCNGIDDDCDGSVDDGLSCGQCVASEEVCDGADNDCDTAKDEGFVCCSLDQAYWELPNSCLDGGSVGAGANISFVVEGDNECKANDGVDTIGIFRPSTSTFRLKDSNSQGDVVDLIVTFGTLGDIPLIGDWNNDGVDTIGIFRPSVGTFRLSNSNTNPKSDITTAFGVSTDLPVVGDWNNDSYDTIGIFRPSQGKFILSNSNTNPNSDITATFGTSTDIPLIGDWNNDGVDTIGVYMPSTSRFKLSNSNTNPNADVDVTFGVANDLPVVGDWNNDGMDTIGLYRSSNKKLFLSNSNTNPNADVTLVLSFAASGDKPISGDWNQGNVALFIKEEDVISLDDDAENAPMPNKTWFNMNKMINASWIAEYLGEEPDLQGRDEEYYINAKFEGMNDENEIISDANLTVKACNRFIDEDCDGVETDEDSCIGSEECVVVGPSGCVSEIEEDCMALWDCTNAEWSECVNNIQTRVIDDCIYTGDEGTICDDDFKPKGERTCIESEEPFPAFSFSSVIIAILVLAGFYGFRKYK